MKRLLNRIRRHMNSQEGFTLVELLVSVVILIFVSVALMQTALVNIEYNTKNAIRDEATRVAGEKLDEMRNALSNTLTATYNGSTGLVTRTIRNFEFEYDVTNTVTAIGSSGNQLEVFVEWQWKTEMYNTTMSTVR